MEIPTQNTTIPTPIGQRLHIRPSIDYDKVWSAGYIDPQVYFDATSYFTSFQTTNGGVSRPNFDKTRVLPIVDVDTGLYFDRMFNFQKTHYIQTLEPRLFYLYVPYQNQDEYPVFDTQLLPFSYNQIFSINRFTGFDRLDNANQASVGLTSRILNSDTGQEKIRADLGLIYYIQNSKVGLPGISLGPTQTLSPLVGQLTYDINRYWAYSGSLAWDISNGQMNNAGTALTYRGLDNHILSLGYNYIFAEGDNAVDQPLSTNQIYAGGSTPFFNRWTGFGYAGYNFSGKYPVSYMAGLQYDSCCWALRFVFDRHFTGLSPSSTSSNIINQYDNVYYVQLQLKGLASVGNDSAESLLTSRLPGYKDPFSNSL